MFLLKTANRVFIILTVFTAVSIFVPAQNQNPNYPENIDSNRYKREVLKEAKVKSVQKEIEITITNVDITKFPVIKVIVEAYNKAGLPLDTLYANNLTVLENGIEKPVIGVEKITVKERVPVDFVFAIDKTGSMQKYIDAVRRNLTNFTNSLLKRGIDYRIGLIYFSDYVERTYDLTDNVGAFLGWLDEVKAYGGGDEKENALEAMSEATKMKFRPSANKVLVLITDAPYHQKGEKGDGITSFTTESIIEHLNNEQVRVFSIVPPKLQNYLQIAKSTRGNFFDIDYPFSTILDNFSSQLTNLYALKYRTDQPAIPDSINIALLNEKKLELVRKTIPIVELGRKLIIENLLYETNSWELSSKVNELEILYEFMKNKPNVVILVEGHTDNRGSNALNDRLSLLRAESVKKYLIDKGVEPNRIKTKGYGKRKPIATNDTDFGRQLNRRTEIVIVAK
ncbi:MAG: VWA domain-containing protein [Bacteroidetes bacterium]|nr:MAG: VWA domain-containing protein [Bacteroidota bacterium]